MRQADKHKSAMQKATKTINFDMIVLEKLEERARQGRSTTSNIVNMLCRRILMTDSEYYAAIAKEHYLKFQEAMYMKDRAEEIKEMIKTP